MEIVKKNYIIFEKIYKYFRILNKMLILKENMKILEKSI